MGSKTVPGATVVTFPWDPLLTNLDSWSESSWSSSSASEASMSDSSSSWLDSTSLLYRLRYLKKRTIEAKTIGARTFETGTIAFKENSFTWTCFCLGPWAAASQRRAGRTWWAVSPNWISTWNEEVKERLDLVYLESMTKNRRRERERERDLK